MCGIVAYLGNVPENIERYLSIIKHRGPDQTNIIEKKTKYGKAYLGFHRLSINDLSDKGSQPMQYLHDTECLLICNGEIYNHKQLKEKYSFPTESTSDCEIILHMYKRFGIEETVKQLDGVFAFVLYDNETIYIARDIIGVRPLFVGYNEDDIIISSEAKSLTNIFSDTDIYNPRYTIKQFLPGRYATITYDSNKLKYNKFKYFKWESIKLNTTLSQKSIILTINDLLTNAVDKRLMSDRPIGCFLSGGLDSSLICSLMSKMVSKQLVTFAIGMKDSNAPDLKYAKIVADYLQTDHHSVYYTFDEGFEALDDLIYTLESYDITTIRASLPQYLLSKYIKNNTDIKVLFSGEGPDEHFGGYQYLQMSPNKKEFQREITKLTKNLCYYDVLRADRTTSKFGLEVRVPFLDKEFIQYSLSIPPEYKESKNKIEKYLIRKAFDNSNYLPDEILWRQKNAFSDAVGYQWVDRLKEKIDTLISDEEFNECQRTYIHNIPLSKEALYYRKIFNKHYPGRSAFIPTYWMPNQAWSDDKITDPSALKLNCFKED